MEFEIWAKVRFDPSQAGAFQSLLEDLKQNYTGMDRGGSFTDGTFDIWVILRAENDIEAQDAFHNAILKSAVTNRLFIKTSIFALKSVIVTGPGHSNTALRTFVLAGKSVADRLENAEAAARSAVDELLVAMECAQIEQPDA